MIRSLFPIIVIVASILGMIFLAQPKYQTIKEHNIRLAGLDEAERKAQELRAVRAELESKYNSISQSNTGALEKMVPDNVDNVKLSLDIDNIGRRHNLTLNNVTVTEGQDDVVAASSEAQIEPLGRAVIEFNTKGFYSDFLSFINDLEHSLRIIDIQEISFNPLQAQSFEDGQLIIDERYEYDVSFVTYWLRG